MNIYPILYKVRDLINLCKNPLETQIQLFNYNAFHRPIEVVADNSDKIRLNLLVMSIEQEALFGGITTAIKIFQECYKEMDVEARIITLHTPHNYKSDLLKGFEIGEGFDKSIFVAEIDGRNKLPVRKHDYFFSSFWVTALLEDKIYQQQQELYGDIDIPYFSLIQDFEPGFYPWSSNYVEANHSYFTNQKIVGIINSLELYDYFKDINYSFFDAVYFRPTLNDKLKKLLFNRDTNIKRKKQLLIYGRPKEARNAFELVISILNEWSSKLSKDEAKEWTVISLGAKHKNIKLNNGIEVISKGKVLLEQYADYMLSSYAGLSLMVSPHPSYPPLEMSTFGVKTITNTFANKNLNGFNENLISIDNFSCEKAANILFEMTDNFEPGEVVLQGSYLDDNKDAYKNIVDLVKKHVK